MTTTQQCRCGCCGPVEDNPQAQQTWMELERERLEAERRLAELRLADLERRLSELEQPVR